MIQQLAILVTHFKVALVVLHRGDEHFLWNSQVFFSETTSKSGWKFDQVSHFFKQALVQINLPVVSFSKLVDLAHYNRFSIGSISDDKLILECFLIIGCTSEHNWITQETVSFGLSTSNHVDNSEWHDYII